MTTCEANVVSEFTIKRRDKELFGAEIVAGGVAILMTPLEAEKISQWLDDFFDEERGSGEPVDWDLCPLQFRYVPESDHLVIDNGAWTITLTTDAATNLRENLAWMTYP